VTIEKNNIIGAGTSIGDNTLIKIPNGATVE
jgi:UDP-3-O-[3-hydroxymyristoyl] glucosamine N-acyltransferase